ncbi:hypothetical protein BHE90_015486 [Fusarium euwallaceae]|uniref:Uncharacterized protein n=1 Tax=Fusarium euwallaceae TaxID=1147111 RepID=A0A430L350_9HYPO|nr:hypothetical protein BHE90_015486 [Fusarium euwallaceae]
MPTAEEVKASKEETTLDEHMPGYLGDTDVAQHRASGARISRPNQLTAWENCRLNDLAEAWLGVKLGCQREESFSAGTWSRDLDTEPKEDKNQKSSKAARDGTTESKKAKPSKKRKRDDDDEPPKKLEKREESRLCSAEAFLYMVLADGVPTWKWRDASGQTASGRSVDYCDGVTPLDAFIQAIDCHDMFEEARVKDFNEKLILALTRRRIKNWAESGSRGAAIIDPLRVTTQQTRIDESHV